MTKFEKEEIELFRRHLTTFRKLAGWTATDLGEKVGLTRQTIIHLETSPNSMSTIQYIAFRSLFEQRAELQAKKQNPILKDSMAYLLSDQKKDPNRENQVNVIAAAKAGGATTNQILSVINALLPAAIVAAEFFTAFSFLNTILKDD